MWNAWYIYTSGWIWTGSSSWKESSALQDTRALISHRKYILFQNINYVGVPLSKHNIYESFIFIPRVHNVTQPFKVF